MEEATGVRFRVSREKPRTRTSSTSGVGVAHHAIAAEIDSGREARSYKRE
jgi:hypothetical protein